MGWIWVQIHSLTAGGAYGTAAIQRFLGYRFKQRSAALLNTTLICRGAPIRYSVSVSLRYWHFLPDRVSVRRDRSKSDILRILFCVIVKPHESHKNIKHHKVFMHYIPSVLKPLHSLMWGTDAYLSQVDVNSSLRCGCLSSSIQHSNCVPCSVTTVKTMKLSPRWFNVPNIILDL